MNTLILIYLATVIFTLFSFTFFKDKTSNGLDCFDSELSNLIISLIPIINILVSLEHIKISVNGIKCSCGKQHFNNTNLCNDCEFNHYRELNEYNRKRFKENK